MDIKSNEDQRALVTAICDRVRDHLLARSSVWPAHWDGHELRELIAQSFERERTHAMRDRRSSRARAFANDMSILSL